MIKQATFLACAALAVASLPLACFDSDAPLCTVSCSRDADCPSGLSCSADGLCAAAGEICTSSCTPDEFVNCSDPTTIVRCNASGDGIASTSCGTPGCNATEQRCNTCAPDAVSCAADRITLERCGADGMTTSRVETCGIGCVDATATDAARCAVLEPKYLADICTTPATEPSISFMTSANPDTGLQAICNGGIIPQTSAPSLCVIRAGTISVAANVTLRFTGSSIPALVADGDLTIDGTLDVSADADMNGPGGGFTSGEILTGISGGGGAGAKTFGGNGSAAAGTPPSGGAAVDPLSFAGMRGGLRPANSPNNFLLPVSGGAGGGLLLVSCKGTVRISGLLDAGGGGGRGGRDQVAGAQFSPTGAAGGGSGGYVVMQGAQVELTSTARLFANGGGGGAGTNTNDASGSPGADGQRAVSAAIGGSGTSPGGNGGFTSNPTNGTYQAGSGGAGGGAAGWIQIYTPQGVTPIRQQAAVSPSFELVRTVPTR